MYSYHRSITIDHTKVPSTDQSNFPVLIAGTYTYLKTVGNGGKVTNANGYDIIFTSDSAGNTVLNFEIDNYNAATGAVGFWVQVPTVSHTSDTVIYIFYGNSSISSSQENINGTWDSNFKGVWHLPDGTTLSANDSTSNAHNSTSISMGAISGQINGAADGDGVTTSIQFGDVLNISTAVTLSAWVYANSVSSSRTIISKFGDVANDDNFTFRTESGKLFFYLKSGGSFYLVSGSSTLSTSTFYYVTATWDGTTMLVYLNGSQDGTASFSGTADSSTAILKIGYGGLLTGEVWSGRIDEVRYSNIARSADWITAEYNNQSSPSTFYTLGNEIVSLHTRSLGGGVVYPFMPVY